MTPVDNSGVPVDNLGVDKPVDNFGIAQVTPVDNSVDCLWIT